MSVSTETSGRARVSDLDTQRHVTSVTYEHLSLDGRYRILEDHGYPVKRMLEEQIVMRPVSSNVRFLAQQAHGAEIVTRTECHPAKGGRAVWQHTILGAAGEVSCRLDVETIFEKKGRPTQLLPVSRAKAPVEFGPVEVFSGTCLRVPSRHSLRLYDRDIFGRYPLSQYWRLAEEGRWALTDALGINLETIRRNDTTMFWMGGAFRCRAEIPERAQVLGFTWVRRIHGIRAYFRQQFVLEPTGEVLLDTDEEQLIVSLSRARPKRATPEFVATFQKYIEERE